MALRSASQIQRIELRRGEHFGGSGIHGIGPGTSPGIGPGKGVGTRRLRGTYRFKPPPFRPLADR
jgi:hypothetical protein